jgi:hypothetical protein
MRNGKLATIVVFITLSGGLLTPIIFEKLYPVTNIWFTAGILGLISIALNDTKLGQTTQLYLGCIITLAVAYRLRIFLFPASMIGQDPDTYAIQIARLIEVGETSTITFGFYEQAPLHILEGAIAGLITALPAPAASVVYPIVSGITIPLIAASLAHRLRPNVPEATVLAAGVVSVLGYSVQFSYWPVAQSTGVLLLLFTVVSIFAYTSAGDKRWLILGILTMLGVVYTHKLSAVATTLSLTGAVLLGIVHPATRRSKEVKRLATGAFLIVTLLTAVQLLFITGFIRAIIFQLYGPPVPDSSSPSPELAIDPYTFTDRMFALSYVILMGLISGLVWLGLCWRTVQNRGPPQDILFLGFVSPLAALVIALYPAGVNPVRTIFYVEVLLAILIAIGGYWVAAESASSSRSLAQYTAIIGIFVLLISAGVSPTAGPDWDTLNRNYLTAEEVEAKEWGYQRVPGAIAADQYYASESPPARIQRRESNSDIGFSKFESRTSIYLNNSFREDRPPFVVYRDCIEIYRSRFGVWELTYDPEPVLDHTYNRVYDSGCVLYFSSISRTNSPPSKT